MLGTDSRGCPSLVYAGCGCIACADASTDAATTDAALDASRDVAVDGGDAA